MVEDRIQRAKESKKIQAVPDDLYNQVLEGIASNVKMGPFTATSGVILQYYLNSSTNFLDKNVSPKIVELIGRYMENHVLPRLSSSQQQQQQQQQEEYLCVGMEVAGGMMVCQLASANHKYMNSVMDYLYIRKDRKTTGTCQQLEGPQKYTSRTSTSPLLKAIWVDDALSTGGSMLDGIVMLKRDYNIEVVAALYLVDRSSDRLTLVDEKQKLADPVFDKIQILSIYDLQDVDDFINHDK